MSLHPTTHAAPPKPLLPTVDALPNGVRRGEVKRSSGHRVKDARGSAAIIRCHVVRGIDSQHMVQNRTVIGGHPAQVKIGVAEDVDRGGLIGCSADVCMWASIEQQG